MSSTKVIPYQPTVQPTPVANASSTLPRKRKVAFAELASVQPIDCRMTRNERSRCYYTKNDARKFANDVRKSVAMSKRRCAADPVYAPECDRGLEQYVCPDRRKHQDYAKKYVLEYQRGPKANDKLPEEDRLVLLAAISATLSHRRRKR